MLADHNDESVELDIPEMLVGLKDVIYQGLPGDKAQKWPERFLSAIKPGADLSRVGCQFMYWNLTENLTLKDSDDTDVQAAIEQCRAAIKQCSEVIRPLAKGGNPDKEKLSAAKLEALSAVDSAGLSAAKLAVWSAAELAWAAWAAAWAAGSARNALFAESAKLAAELAVWSAAESVAKSVAESVADSAAYEKMADKLIELLEQAA